MENSRGYLRTILAGGAIVLSVVAILAVIANAQSQPTQPSTEPLPALLAEVHALRLAMERSSSITPRLQLDQARLNIEEQRISQLSQQLDQVRQQIAHNSQELQTATESLADVEKALQTEKDAQRREQFAREQIDDKHTFDTKSALDQQLRAREADALRAYDTEQNRWTDLNNRLDELEKLLGPVGQH